MTSAASIVLLGAPAPARPAPRLRDATRVAATLSLSPNEAAAAMLKSVELR